jgi:hypothetical protein
MADFSSKFISLLYVFMFWFPIMLNR